MRFKKWPCSTPFEITERKRAGVLLSQRRKREALPLLAPLIAETQPSVDAVMEQREALWARHQQADRDRRATNWREARRQIEGLSGNLRPLIRALWNEAPYPADPNYLLDFLFQIERGKIDPDAPPWRITLVEKAEMQRRFNAFLERTAAKRAASTANAPAADGPDGIQRRAPIRLRSNGLLTAGDHD